MINVKYPRRGFVVEEVTKGCETEGCNAEKLVVVPWENYGEENFNYLTENMTVGQNHCDDDNEGLCPQCEKPVNFKQHLIVTSDASTIETAEDALNYAVDVLNAPFPEGETLIATDADSSYLYALNGLEAPFPEGEIAIAKCAYRSYNYADCILKAPFPLGEAAIATNAHIFKMYKNLFPEPQVVEANGHLEVAKDLEDKKYEKINYGTFFCAASKGDLEVVKYLVELIEKDTPIATWMDSERDDDESSYAVWEAASNGHLEVVKYLVGEKGAYIGISTAFYAGTNGHLEVLKYLVDEKGAKIDDIKEAVKHCIEHGHLEVVKYLVEKLTHTYLSQPQGE